MEQLTTHTKQEVADGARHEVVIHLEHLKKSFGEKAVLTDINLDLKKNENLVILGRSGEGKSVTIKCIVGLLNQDEGVCEVLGKEISELKDAELKGIREKVGFLFQGSALYDSMTVRENLAFPLTRVLKIKDGNEIQQRVEEMLSNVGLAEAIDKMPEELSGGMKKRVSLARTMILKPEIILYDEPTTGLDPITSKEISTLILDMQRKYKISSIIITHDIPCARITASRIMIMSGGKFITEGTYDELEKSDDELVRSFFK